MDSLEALIDRLRIDREQFFNAWIGTAGVNSRVDASGNVVKEGGLVTCVTLAETALRFLPAGDPKRQEILKICREKLSHATASGWPWTLSGESADSAAAYVTGLTLASLGKEGKDLVEAKVLDRALTCLESWLLGAVKNAHALELPLICRAALALQTCDRAKPEVLAQVGQHAQVLIHRSVSSHALGSPSQFNPNLVCMGLAMDNLYSANPLPQHERERCLKIAFKDHEPLITLRSTITSAGTAAVGCSTLEVLRNMFVSKPLARSLYSHEDQIGATLAWLEDHSSTVGINKTQMRLFQSDLWPNFQAFDAWFNCLALMFLDDLERHLNDRRQAELRERFRATVPVSKFEFEKAPCGGFVWPQLLKGSLLKDVAQRGSVDSGNGIVLFGPPGTGKTTLAKLIAKQIPHWYFVELSTADFFLDGQENLFRSIRNIFQSLRQLKRCVVFFDELELLVQERGEDWESAAITNVMLPELQQLHDSHLVIPIFATNHISRFDRAGRRPGRFDYILPVGLPSKGERLDVLKDLLSDSPAHLFNGIENISEGSTIRELSAWARQYRLRTPGETDARKLWDSGFNRLADTTSLNKFQEDISKYAYPPGVSVAR